MKSIIFLSHLHDEHERGGAYLRNSALTSCLNSWGIQVKSFYRGDFILKSQKLKKLIMGLRYGKQVRSLFTKSQFTVPECDALIIDTMKYFSWNYSFTGKSPIKIYNAHNLEFENHFGKESSVSKDKFARFEAKTLEKMDIVLVCSEREKKVLCSLNPKLYSKIFVFPNLVAQERFVSKSLHSKTLISFIGTLDYYPNVEAVKFLVSHFFSKLPDDLKEKFVIAGRRPSSIVTKICKEKGIALRLDLTEAEITELYLQTDVLLVPIVHGSGTRLKIIEGILSGCRVLSTPVGREGINSSCIIETELSTFTDKFLSIYKNKNKKLKVDQTFLDNYELGAWAKANRHHFFNFLEQKTIQ